MTLHNLERARPFCDWHQDIGNVLWWQIPIEEAPYVGTPLDCEKEIDTFVGVKGYVARMLIKHSGWPFGENPQNLWWTPLPDGKMIEDQVPL